MNDAEAAYRDFNAHLDSYGARLHADEESFVAGYSAASAATSARAEEAVRATISKALDVAIGATMISPSPIGALHGMGWNDAQKHIEKRIRALDVARIVAQVMGGAETPEAKP